MSGDRPVRLIRARDLQPGTVVLEECPGPGDCDVPSDTHTDTDTRVVHELTLLDAETNPGIGEHAGTSFFTAITVTAAGDQYEYMAIGHSVVRVYADTAARTEARDGAP